MDLSLVNENMEKARIGDLSVHDLIYTADVLYASGDSERAKQIYYIWLEQCAEHPFCYAIYYNFSVLLGRLQDHAAARQALEESVRRNPDYLPAQINLGFALERSEGKAAALARWLTVVDRFPQVTGDTLHYLKFTLAMIGRVMEDTRDLPGAEEVFRRGLDLDPDQPEVMNHYLSLRQQQCKWPVISPWASAREVTRRQLLANINPLTLAIYSDDPLFQLGNAHYYATVKAGAPSRSFADRHQPRPPADGRRLRIGYVSAELRHHAGGFLMAEVFELHDKTGIEVFAYSTVPTETDGMGGRIRAAIEHWRDISGLSDEQAAEQIFADQIDILVDMQGHTFGSRPTLMAMRPAPVIVGWLGFPGSVGTAYHNYIIADDFIIPASHELYYSENIARLPCYQPNDRKRQVADRCPSRAEVGLPEPAMVYCAFNGQHKITPFTWQRWMRILQAVGHSVLWLLESTDPINQQLKQLAASHGVSPDRILFAPRLGNAEHLARYPLADLFLDTAPYGAHTTASDALWMGVPILTLVGRSFASRVCGSIMRAGGLPELICSSAEHYVATAIALGRAPAVLQGYRDRLRACRDNSILFDTPLLVRSLEGEYRKMHQRFVAGRQQQPDLTNLGLYRDIGMELDEDQREMLSCDDYAALYRDRIIERRRYSFVPPDRRLAE